MLKGIFKFGVLCFLFDKAFKLLGNMLTYGFHLGTVLKDTAAIVLAVALYKFIDAKMKTKHEKQLLALQKKIEQEQKNSN